MNAKRQLCRRFSSLHQRGIKQDLRRGKTPSRDADHISDRRTRRRRDDPNARGDLRNGLFAFGIEKSLRRKLPLELLELQRERTDPIGLKLVRIELILPRGTVERDVTVHDDAHSVGKSDPQSARIAAKHHRLDLSRFVLEGKIDMSRAREREIGDLTANEKVGKDSVAVQKHFQIIVELTDRQRSLFSVHCALLSFVFSFF